MSVTATTVEVVAPVKSSIRSALTPRPVNSNHRLLNAVLQTINQQQDKENVSPKSTYTTPRQVGNKECRLFKTARIWCYNYNIHMQFDGVGKDIEVALVRHAELLRRIVIKDEIVIHFMENPEIMRTVISLIQKGPNCNLKICARGFVEQLMPMMDDPLNFTKCILIDLKFDYIVPFSHLLRVLRKATHIEVDLNGFYFEYDVGQMFQHWDREASIVQFVLHGVPSNADKVALNHFIEDKLTNEGTFQINFLPDTKAVV